ADRVDPHCENDWDNRCCLPNYGDRAADCDNYIDLETDKLSCDLGVAFGAALRPAILDLDVATLGPAKFTQAYHKGRCPRTKGRSVRAQEPDSWEPADLLCPRYRRPGRRSTDETQNLPPPHSFPQSQEVTA